MSSGGDPSFPAMPQARTRASSIKCSIAWRGLIMSEKAVRPPSLRTGRADLPHPALQSVVCSSGLASQGKGRGHGEQPLLGKVGVGPALMVSPRPRPSPPCRRRRMLRRRIRTPLSSRPNVVRWLCLKYSNQPRLVRLIPAMARLSPDVRLVFLRMASRNCFTLLSLGHLIPRSK